METKKNVKVIQEEQGFVLPKSNQFKETFQRLCENKAALAGMVFLILLISVSICADFLFNYQETCVQQNIMERLQWPSWEHPFGTDEFGRDFAGQGSTWKQDFSFDWIYGCCFWTSCGRVFGNNCRIFWGMD